MHRYGRHGQGAWLRQNRKRRKKRTSAPIVLKLPFTVTTIPFPVGVGRIIIIVAGEGMPEDFDEINPQGLPPPVVDAIKTASLPDTEVLQKISGSKQRAIECGEFDAEEILKNTFRHLNGHFLALDLKQAEEIARKKGSARLLSLPYDNNQFSTLVDAYVQAYLSALEKAATKTDAHHFLSEKEIRIQEIAKKDREEERFVNDQGVSHLREIAVIRALETIPVPLEEAIGRADEIRAWADRYEDAWKTPKKWEVWSTQDSFRDTSW